MIYILFSDNLITLTMNNSKKMHKFRSMHNYTIYSLIYISELCEYIPFIWEFNSY